MSGGEQVASGAEVRSNDSVNPDKPLSVSSGFEASHSSLPFTRRLMRVLRTVVQVPMLPMRNAGHYHSLRRPIAAQFVGNYHPWTTVRGSPQQLAKQANGGKPIAFRLHEDVEDNAVLIDCSPQVVSDAVDLEEDFVEMPFIPGSSTPFSQAIGILLAELLAPPRTVS